MRAEYHGSGGRGRRWTQGITVVLEGVPDMQCISRFAGTWTVAGIVTLIAAGQHAAAQQPVSVTAASGTDLDALRRWDTAVDRMTRTGDLVVTSRLDDRALAGRSHEYLAQAVDGVRVLGGGVSRQLDAGGATVSLLGTLHQGIDVDTTPTLSANEVASHLEQAHGGRLVAGRRPALVVLPLPDGTYALSYRVVMSDGRYYFADADDGRILHVADAFRRQSAVGSGNDFQGRRKKLSTTQVRTRYQALDRLRPAEIVTLDGRFDFLRLDRLLLEHFLNDLPRGEPVWQASDVAADTDNEWEDTAVVEATRTPAGPTTTCTRGTAGGGSTAPTGASSASSMSVAAATPSLPRRPSVRRARACTSTNGRRTACARSR